MCRVAPGVRSPADVLNRLMEVSLSHLITPALGALCLSPTSETACNHRTDCTFPNCFSLNLQFLLDALNWPVVADT